MNPDGLGQDPYETLGVDPNVDAPGLRRAYRDLARKLHPDAGASNDPATVRRFKAVTEAYAILSDPALRATHDAERARATTPEPEPQPAPAAAPRAEESTASAPRPGPTAAASTPTKGADVHLEVQVPFSHARFGGRTIVKVPGLEVCGTCAATGAAPDGRARLCENCRGTGSVRETPGAPASRCAECAGDGKIIDQRCPTCAGEGIVRGFRSVTVPVPIGVEPEQVLRLPGQGEAGMAGMPPGDLYVKISLDAHPVFGRRGRDLTLKLPVSLGEVLIGSRLKVPTLDGLVEVELPAGTRSGALVRLQGRGLPGAEGAPGDLIVAIDLEMPQELDKKARKAAEAFAKATEGTGEALRTEIIRAAAQAHAEAAREAALSGGNTAR